MFAHRHSVSVEYDRHRYEKKLFTERIEWRIVLMSLMKCMPFIEKDKLFLTEDNSYFVKRASDVMGLQSDW